MKHFDNPYQNEIYEANKEIEIMKKNKIKQFYKKHIYSKSELYLALLALCLTLIALIVALISK